MPHLRADGNWDFKDQLQMVDKGNNCKAYYVYDGSGERVRKVIEQNGTPLEERIYLGGFEVYHKYGTNPLERETLHIMDDKQRIAMVDTRTSRKRTRMIRAADPLPVRQSPRLGQRGAYPDSGYYFLRRVLSLWQYIVSGRTPYGRGEAQALPLHRQGAG